MTTSWPATEDSNGRHNPDHTNLLDLPPRHILAQAVDEFLYANSAWTLMGPQQQCDQESADAVREFNHGELTHFGWMS